MSHDINDFKLSNKIVDEELDGLNAEMIFEFLNVGSLIHDLHEVLSSFLVVNSVDAGLGEPLGELLHNMIASFHDLGSWEWLHFQEGVAYVLLMIPELILILSIITSYLLLS